MVIGQRENILEIQDLTVHYYSIAGVVKAVNGVNLKVRRGEILGLVGESGCGKTTLGLSILRLLPLAGRIVCGRIIYNGVNLLDLNDEEMRKNIRGKKISMIFQDPTTALNPIFKIEEQMIDVVMAHVKASRKEAHEIVANKLAQVGLPDYKHILKRYPHELSTGMRQRVMIAMALLCNPSLLIADEPTSSLDVVTQLQILKLLKDLTERLDISILFITHNQGIVAGICDRMAIMYAGRIVESGDVDDIFNEPLHPYTQGLINAVPSVHRDVDKLYTMEGEVVDLINPPLGCTFYQRCKYSMSICEKELPENINLGDRLVACFLYRGLNADGDYS